MLEGENFVNNVVVGETLLISGLPRKMKRGIAIFPLNIPFPKQTLILNGSTHLKNFSLNIVRIEIFYKMTSYEMCFKVFYITNCIFQE